MTLQRAAAAIVAAMGLIAWVGCASYAAPSGRDLHAPPLASVAPEDIVGEEELRALGWEDDGMSSEQNDLMTEIGSRFQGDERFSGFEWLSETGTLKLWWHGPVPLQLEQRLSSFEPPIAIEQTVNPPHALAVAVDRIMAPGAIQGVFVSAAGASIDCSHLTVMAEATDASISEAHMADAIEAVAGFPISLEVGTVVPIAGTEAGEQ